MNIKLNILIDQILAEVDYLNNPYFVYIDSGLFDKNDFLETQIQFYFAVIFFSRPMATLAAKIPTPELRMEVLRNVWEEHGEGDAQLVHGATFVELLSRLDNSITQKEINTRSLWPEVRIFNTTLIGSCALDDYLIGAGVMGIIERMFSDISTVLGKGIVRRGWLPPESMIHYNIHEELDIKHSQDFFNVLESSWKRGAQDRYHIEQGLRMGAVLFNDLYHGLFNNRKRRIFKEV
jgi:hypothetical protein